MLRVNCRVGLRFDNNTKVSQSHSSSHLSPFSSPSHQCISSMIYLCVYVLTTRIHMYTTCTHIHMYTACTHTHIHMYTICTHTRTHTHTHTHIQESDLAGSQEGAQDSSLRSVDGVVVDREQMVKPSAS